MFSKTNCKGSIFERAVSRLVLAAVLASFVGTTQAGPEADGTSRVIDFPVEDSRIYDLRVHEDWIALSGEISLEFVGRNWGLVTNLRLESFREGEPSVRVTPNPDGILGGRFLVYITERNDISFDFDAIVTTNGISSLEHFYNEIDFGSYWSESREFPRFGVAFQRGDPLLRMTLHPSPEHADRFFQRGDSNDDGAVDLSDATAILQFLFLAGAAPSCEDAADTNDDGVLNLTDAVVVLEHLFLGGDPEPLGGRLPCWIDFTPDELTCDGQDACRR